MYRLCNACEHRVEFDVSWPHWELPDVCHTGFHQFRVVFLRVLRSKVVKTARQAMVSIQRICIAPRCPFKDSDIFGCLLEFCPEDTTAGASRGIKQCISVVVPSVEEPPAWSTNSSVEPWQAAVPTCLRGCEATLVDAQPVIPAFAEIHRFNFGVPLEPKKSGWIRGAFGRRPVDLTPSELSASPPQGAVAIVSQSLRR